MATSTAEWIEELKGISVLELSERMASVENAPEAGMIGFFSATLPILTERSTIPRTPAD